MELGFEHSTSWSQTKSMSFYMYVIVDISAFLVCGLRWFPHQYNRNRNHEPHRKNRPVTRLNRGGNYYESNTERR